MPLLTNHLTAAEFGRLSGFIIYINLLATFAMFSSNGYVSVKFHKLDIDDFKKSFFLIHLLFVIWCLFLNLGFYWIGSLGAISVVSEYTYFYPLITLLFGFHLLSQAFFQTSESVNQFVYSKLIVAVFDLSLCFAILSFGNAYDIVARPLSWAIGLSISLIYSYFFIVRYFVVEITVVRLKEIALFCIPLFPHVAVGTLNGFMDKLLVLEKVGAEQMAQYMAAVYVSTAFLILIEPINKVFAPWIFKTLKVGEVQLVKHYIRTYCLGLTFLSVVFAISGVLVFDYFVPAEYSEAKNILPLLVGGCLFQGFYYCRVNILFFFERNLLISSISSSVLIINIVLTIMLTNIFGAVGAASSFLAMNVLMYILSHRASERELARL